MGQGGIVGHRANEYSSFPNAPGGTLYSSATSKNWRLTVIGLDSVCDLRSSLISHRRF